MSPSTPSMILDACRAFLVDKTREVTRNHLIAAGVPSADLDRHADAAAREATIHINTALRAIYHQDESIVTGGAAEDDGFGPVVF